MAPPWEQGTRAVVAMCALLALASLVEPGSGAAALEGGSASSMAPPLVAGAGAAGLRRLLASGTPLPVRRPPPPPIRRPLAPRPKSPPPRPPPPHPRPPPPRPRPPPPRPPPPGPPPPRPPPPHPQPPLPPHPPPAPPAPPAPPRPPPPPAQRDTEVAWNLWTRFLHRQTGFTPVPNGPAGPASPLIQKLLPETYQNNLFVSQSVPGGTSPINAADIWSNMQYSYDPFFLYPLGSLLADELRQLYFDATDTALIPNAALAPFGNATNHRVSSYPGFNQLVTNNPNIEDLPQYMPTWAFDSTVYQEAYTEGRQNEQGNLGWAFSFNIKSADLAQNVEWSRYTLDGSSALAPPLGLSWDDPVATPQWNFLDLLTSEYGLLTRRSQVGGLESYTLEARGWFYGKVGPNPKWYPVAALAAARPTRRPAQRVAADYFAARFGSLPIVPRSAAAVYSPRLRFVLTPNAFSAFVAFWTNGTAKDIRRLQSLVWLIDRNITSSGSVTWDVGTRTVTAQPPAGRWYRLAQVMEVVNVPYFFGGLAGAPPPPAPPPFEYLPPAPPGSKAPF